MARFGVEGVRYFGAARAAGFGASDLTYVFNICNGLDEQLRDAGHTRAFYWANNDCWETDLRSSGMGGDDDNWADDVRTLSEGSRPRDTFVSPRARNSGWKRGRLLGSISSLTSSK
jgi:Family of unknown function (DUF6345)